MEDDFMKSARLLAVAFVACASVPLMMAQQVDASAQQNGSASAAGVHANDESNANASANGHGRADANGSAESSIAAPGRRHSEDAGSSEAGSAAGSAEMRPVTGELEGKLDSKTAKPGDQVVLKTNQKMKTADGMIIPKGSRLVGHVTEVEAHAKGHEESRMGLEFDRLEMKNGESMALHSMIQSVQPNASAMAASSMDDEAALSAPIGGGGAMAGGGARAGGGLLGGAAGGVGSAAGGVGSTTGRVGSDLNSSAGGAMHATGNLAGEAGGTVGRGVGATAQGAGSLGAHATGIPGVMLNGDAAGSASGMLTAANRNIHLDSGTQMVLGVAAAR
jgi:hypothetical protein